MKSQLKHPWCKKSCGQESKKGHAEIDVKSKGLLLLMEFKFLIMMTRPQNTVATLLAGNGNVLWPGQKFKFHQQQEALAAHFDFTSFSAWPFFRFLAATFFTPGVFWLG